MTNRLRLAPMAPAPCRRRLRKRYGRTTALRGVDLEVGEGELVGLLGPNGAGKSTLVKIACGLVRASAGRREVCGAPGRHAAARARARLPRRAVPLPGLVQRRRGARAAPEARRLGRRRARARASCSSSSGSRDAARPPGRGDVEGDAAAARDRAGAGRQPAAAAARRADERARPGRPADRARAARGAARAAASRCS